MIKKHISYQAICDGCKQKTYDTFTTYKSLEKTLKQEGWKKYRKDKKVCLACPRCAGVKPKESIWALPPSHKWYTGSNYFPDEVIKKMNLQYNEFLKDKYFKNEWANFPFVASPFMNRNL